MAREGIGNENSSEEEVSARVVVGMARSRVDSGVWKSEGYALIEVVPNGLFEGFFATHEAARAELISKVWEEVHSNIPLAWELLPLKDDLFEKLELRRRRINSVQSYVARAFSSGTGVKLYEIIVYDEHGNALPAPEQPRHNFLIIEGGRVVLAMTEAEAKDGFKHYCEMIEGRKLKSGFSTTFK
ncbi:hypothetical protein [Xanthomonas arboricola]|uniref:hypothetical protein n=1 Tax=Xanthomonas arboricola TaxID=56448 RepID=UPI0011B02F1F|nr:hypothetical protein [Xanthomonas arboricola]